MVDGSAEHIFLPLLPPSPPEQLPLCALLLVPRILHGILVTAYKALLQPCGPIGSGSQTEIRIPWRLLTKS